MKDDARERDPQAVFGDLAEGLLDRVGVAPGDRLLDVACGAWVVGRAAAARGASFVAGIDVNAARLRAGGARQACRARAEGLPFADACFSLVTCQHGLMFFDDRLAALDEAGRMLRAGGRYAVTGWCGLDEHPGFRVLHSAIASALGPDAAASAARPFSLPDPQRVADEVERAGFVGIGTARLALRIASPSPEAFARWYLLRTSLAPFVAGRPEVVERICREAANELAAFLEADGLSLPAPAWVVVARRP